MAFGLIFSSIIPGLSLAIWGLFHGYSIPAAVLLHSLAGTAGAILFMAFAVIRPGLRDRVVVAHQSPGLN
ncbi:hypothetical protein [Rhodobacter sp. CZR27]|uniref:hypothetical protein n=1 Tax=Rhodobacter sp. CZR27 TaxID=2033869 RepID=UPI000BBE5DA2|nr:hypothetical protein [Rhodobacter sp. CZR27]